MDIGFFDAAAMTDADPSADTGTPPPPAPDEMGPHQVMTMDESVRRGLRRTPVVAHIPGGAGKWPLVVFLPGFQLDSHRYAALADRVASHGFVVLRADPPDPVVGVDHLEMVDDVVAVIYWATTDGEPLARHVDRGQIAVMGHSLGGKIATMVAHGDRRIKALLGLDPVNGAGPLGFSRSLPDILPSRVEALQLPVGFLGETTNSQGGALSPACAPDGENFVAFYAAATSARWAASWDFAGADHMDFVDDTDRCVVCGTCPDGTADEATVSRGIHAIAVAFFRLHLAGDSQVQAWLTGVSVPAGVSVEHRQ